MAERIDLTFDTDIEVITPQVHQFRRGVLLRLGA
jgi:hypothetical protein